MACWIESIFSLFHGPGRRWGGGFCHIPSPRMSHESRRTEMRVDRMPWTGCGLHPRPPFHKPSQMPRFKNRQAEDTHFALHSHGFTPSCLQPDVPTQPVQTGKLKVPTGLSDLAQAESVPDSHPHSQDVLRWRIGEFTPQRVTNTQPGRHLRAQQSQPLR